MERLSTFIEDTQHLVTSKLHKFLPLSEQPPSVLHEAMRYVVLGGGKRLRPIITLASCSSVTDDPLYLDISLDVGCSVELLHTYSLVHDDLPSMDDDDLRRNRLTCHKAFGEAVAILVGDALQAKAFEILARCSGDLAQYTVFELATASGSMGMVGGQILDLEGEGKAQDIDKILRIDRLKTGSLITSCCRLGGIVGRSSPEELSCLTEYGYNLGLLYQITDDLLDVTSSKEVMGKHTSKDIKLGKQTYPAALGLQKAKSLAMEIANKAKRAIINFDKKALWLRLLVDYILHRKS